MNFEWRNFFKTGTLVGTKTRSLFWSVILKLKGQPGLWLSWQGMSILTIGLHLIRHCHVVLSWSTRVSDACPHSGPTRIFGLISGNGTGYTLPIHLTFLTLSENQRNLSSPCFGWIITTFPSGKGTTTNVSRTDHATCWRTWAPERLHSYRLTSSHQLFSDGI